MAVQNLPPFYTMPYTDKDGNLTSQASFHNDQTFQALNNLVNQFNDLLAKYNVSSLTSTIIQTNVPALQTVGITAPALIGLNAPSFTTAQITAIMAVTPPVVAVGTIWYNSSLKKLQFKSDTSVVETITST